MPKQRALKRIDQPYSPNNFAPVVITAPASGGLPTDPVITDFTSATHTHQNAAGGGILDHGLALTGLGDDDHSQYALLLGRAGGQSLNGGTASGDDLTIKSTTHATKGDIWLDTFLTIANAGLVTVTTSDVVMSIGNVLFNNSATATQQVYFNFGGGLSAALRRDSGYLEIRVAPTGFRWVSNDGLTELAIMDTSGNLLQKGGQRIEASEVRARSSAGLLLRDTSANLGIFIEDGGEVGIGTTTPSSRLDILTATNKSVRFFEAVAGSNGIPSGLTGLGSAFSMTRPSDGADGILDLFVVNTNDLGLRTRSNFHWYTNVTEVMTLVEAGILSVGTVRAFGATGLNLQDDGGNFGLFVQDGGNVGVGTSSPTRLFQIDGATTPAISVKASTTERGQLGAATATNSWFTGAAAGDFALRAQTHDMLIGSLGASTNLRFFTVAAERARIDASGNMGIGVTPTAKLQVNGSFAILDGMTAPATITGYAVIYVDTADGDLKIKFGDGVVKTIVVDT